MLCYKDMTFCEFDKECANGSCCDRALTPKIVHDADDFGLPVCLYANKPECFKDINKEGLDK